MLKKVPNPIDRHVGSRVRMRRMLAGVSQERLGEALGLTFQQVQKYEKGTNRISASRLQQISKMLGVPVAFFFDGAPADDSVGNGFADASATTYVADFLATSEGVQLTKAFVRIKSPRVRDVYKRQPYMQAVQIESAAHRIGDRVMVEIERAGSNSLFGRAIEQPELAA